MNQAEEDALVHQHTAFARPLGWTNTSRERIGKAIRLAIRAAYARGVEAEREKAARVAKAWADDDMRTDEVDAAIRRGES